MDGAIERLSRVLEILLFPSRFQEWQKKHHPRAAHIFDYFKNRHALIIMAGDVGTGKTELSETIGSYVARKSRLEITLFPMSLSTRGSGLVGEMTRLISSAFHHVKNESEKIARTKEGTYRSGVIMLIDEADALAQSRQDEQMHHEDRAGVNALIRGLDTLNRQQLPVAVIMCTNRIEAIDPAITRRAAETLVFERPDRNKLLSLLQQTFGEIGFTQEQIEEIVDMTGPTNGRDYGFTFSDITQKLFHSVVMSAYPDRPISHEQVISAVKKIVPTSPFKNNV
ncbi:MAG: ATP-binding protein [Nitrospira sp.]|nr:ATP-binding protein [Nitrospira sp.]